ncbi:MAG: methyltransferase domain-containing protein [Nitrosomonas sp.]|nr:methyltransferase domain-containing protein [Nitrosomonas sp.]
MLYRFFLRGVPFYLARHYWWAYLWKPAIWFFDHQIIINAILFGQYKRLMNTTLDKLAHTNHQRTLQLTCVYGQFTQKLAKLIAPTQLHIMDVCIHQLHVVQRKTQAISPVLPTRMNAETLGYKNDSFTTIVLFFLLHELPTEARQNTLSECMRTLTVGGSLLLTEYGVLPKQHWLYRNKLTRWLITYYEPFLDSFWHDDLTKLLNERGKCFGKKVEVISNTDIFNGFYRVTAYKIYAVK